MKNLFLTLLFSNAIVCFSQTQTVGLFQYDSSAVNGYTLFSADEKTYLIDNCGYLINEWQSNFNAGNSAYLLENGDLLRTCRIQSSIFSGGGSGGRVELRDWYNNLKWSYNFSNIYYHQHHDIEPLDNGNILILCWKRYSSADAILAGRRPNALVDNELWATYIIEVEPIGTDSMKIIWEWNLWDHLVQDFDSTKNNFGIIENHPELLNINYYNGNGKKDWMHCNSIDYNESLQQIVIGSRSMSEFYIIDHSTTTTQASSSSGGIYGRGGDFLYRWGNPQVYNKGNSSNRRLFGQHDVQWIEDGLADEKKILIFNNGQSRGYSSVEIVNTQFQNSGYYQLSTIGTFIPDSSEWIYVADNPTDFFSSYISGAQRLKNGNTLICDGAHGTFFEIDKNKSQVWKYINPVVNNLVLNQGDSIPSSSNGWANNVFRAERYYPDYSAFNGKSMVPLGPIEGYPFSYSCFMPTNIINNSNSSTKKISLVFDILGRKCDLYENQLLLLFYSDGTVEKKIILK